jgi:hypothetical protein
VTSCLTDEGLILEAPEEKAGEIVIFKLRL